MRNLLIIATWALCAAGLPAVALAELPAPSSPAGAAVVTTEQRGQAYSHLMRALVSARRGEVAAAISEIHQALELLPDSPDLLTESAELMLQWTGRVSEAEALARRALGLDPEHRGAILFLAELGAARALGPERDASSRDEAIGLFETLAATDEEANLAQVLQTLVQLRLQANDLPGALADVRRLVLLRPGDLRATQTLAQLLLRSGQEPEALELLLSYVADHPWEEDLMGWAEQLANGLQAWDSVVGFLQLRTPFRDDAPLLSRFYGEALLRVGRLSEAVEVLERASHALPGEIKIRKDLALAYRGIGRLADAAALFSDLVRESPDYPLLQQLLAETLENQQDVDGALAAYDTALTALMSREDVAASYRDAIRQRMAFLYLDRGRLAEAGSTLAAIESPDNALSLEIGCRLAIANRDWDAARKLTRAVADEGRTGRGALLEGEIAVGEKKWTRARSRFGEALEILGAYARPNVAEVYRDAGRPEDGLRLLVEWVEQAPELADARFHLGVYYYELERHEDAERELREAFRLEPRHARALNFLGYSLAERSTRLEEALGMVQRALEVDSWNGAYLDSLGWVYYQMGRYEDARQPLERAARELPKDPIVLEHLGDLYHSLGDHAGAMTAWSLALDASPGDAELLRGKIRRVAEAGSLAAEDGSR